MKIILQLLIIKLLFSAPCSYSQDGFERFDTPPDSGSTDVPIDSGTTFDAPAPPPMGPDDYSDNEYYDDGSGDEYSDGSENGSNGKDGGDGKGNNSEKKYFGRNKKVAPKKDTDKYVNLNPETGFGPEIVESFDFPDTDILELTKHMQKLTGINLILDKDVKGKVSLSAPTPITVGDAWKAYLAALSMAGYTLVKTGSFYRIIPLREIRYTPTKIYMGEYTPETENFVTKVIPLKYASAKEIAKNYRQFNTRYGRIIELEQTNTLLIQDTGTNIKRLEMLVKTVDTPGFEESLQIIKVLHTSAQEIAKLLDNILQDGKTRSSAARTSRFSSSSSPNIGPSISKIIAEPRTNSIIAMANEAGKKQLETLIGKLDVQNASKGSNRIQVYYLQYGDAESLAKTLTELISSAKAQSSSTNNNDNGGYGGSSRFSNSRNGTVSLPESIFSEEVKVNSDKATNSIVVTASPTDWLTVKDVIKKLDIPRDQVYVEGLILETRVDKGSAFGINYAIPTGKTDLSKSGFNSGLNGPKFENLLDNSAFGLGGLFAGLGFGKTVELQMGSEKRKVSTINALIKAVATAQNTNILATPQLLVMDNSEGTFEANEKQPYKKSDSTANTVSSGLGEQEVKLKLKINPQINKETRFIKLKIQQEISEFTAQQSTLDGGGLPTIGRTVDTEVIVRDRDTIAMGGLLRDKETETESKVPLLGDVPVLGWLFKSKSKDKGKTNVIFFLTPRIISPYEKLAAQNTKRVIEERKVQKGKTTDDPTLFDDKLSQIDDQVQKQMNGPLFNNESHEESAKIEAPTQLQKDEIEVPNYQDIKKELQ